MRGTVPGHAGAPVRLVRHRIAEVASVIRMKDRHQDYGQGQGRAIDSLRLGNSSLPTMGPLQRPHGRTAKDAAPALPLSRGPCFPAFFSSSVSLHGPPSVVGTCPSWSH
jgi:hypothetical protein